MNKFLSLTAACLLTSTALLATNSVPTTTANSSIFAIGPKIGTLGAGLEGSFNVSKEFKLRVGVNGLRYSKKFNDGDMNWSGKLTLLTVGAMADYHPFQNGFRLSAGVMYNGNKLDVSATPANNVNINGQNYTPAQVGTTKGTLDFRKIAPYIGIGYDGALTSNGALSFNAEVGVLFQGSPRASVSATGLLRNQTAFLNNLKAEVEQATNKSWLRYYPVVSVGFKYRF